MTHPGAQPPEIISLRIHAGPGANSIWAAADAWSKLGERLHEVATRFSATITSLAGVAWRGSPVSVMITAAASYADVLYATAARAE